MKGIYGGMIYDTAKAEEVGCYCEGEGIFRFTETLYRTRNGRLFLFGNGESYTEYYDEKQKLWPVDDDEAFEWLQRRQLADEAIMLFPDRIAEA